MKNNICVFYKPTHDELEEYIKVKKQKQASDPEVIDAILQAAVQCAWAQDFMERNDYSKAIEYCWDVLQLDSEMALRLIDEFYPTVKEKIASDALTEEELKKFGALFHKVSQLYDALNNPEKSKDYSDCTLHCIWNCLNKKGQVADFQESKPKEQVQEIVVQPESEKTAQQSAEKSRRKEQIILRSISNIILAFSFAWGVSVGTVQDMYYLPNVWLYSPLYLSAIGATMKVVEGRAKKQRWWMNLGKWLAITILIPIVSTLMGNYANRIMRTLLGLFLW